MMYIRAKPGKQQISAKKNIPLFAQIRFIIFQIKIIHLIRAKWFSPELQENQSNVSMQSLP